MLTCFPKLPENFQLVQMYLAKYIPCTVLVLQQNDHESQSHGTLIYTLNHIE